MEDGYLLYATLHWEDTPFNTLELGDPAEALHLLDANGQELIYELHDDEQTGVRGDQRQTVFALKTAPIQTAGPLTLALDWVTANVPVEAHFVFDPGSNPQPGQEWQLDREIPFGDILFGDRRLRVRSVTNDGSGYSFDMTSSTGIQYAILTDHEHTIISGVDGQSSHSDTETVFFSSFNYAEGLPKGPITISVGSIAVKYDRPLRVQWTPPAASPVQLPTQPAACLTRSAWQAALAQPPALPADLTGRLLTFGPVDKKNFSGAWEFATTALDGSNRRPIPGAENGAFSPDGALLAYSTPADGIHILDLATGAAAPLPGTAHGDFHPVWNPDGKRIVFNRGAGVFDLFITNLDGTEMRPLTQGGGQEWPVGWLADGSFLYSVPGKVHEYTVYRLDLQSGERAEYARTNIDSVSPDRNRILTMQPAFGDRWLVSISELDGANPWLLGGSDLLVLSPTWSPDGQWLLALVSEKGPDKGIGALINLQTCQVTALPEIYGSILGWAK